MADETRAEWETRHEQEARLAAARWAIALVDAHPELLELVEPEMRRFYVAEDDE